MYTIVWQYGNSNPENSGNLDTIRQWWQSNQGKEIIWQQRILPPTANLEEIDWQAQRFDESFVLTDPDLRGITLYWRKPDAENERNTTASKLVLEDDRLLYIFPQSQPELVYRITSPQPKLQRLELDNPTPEGVVVEGNFVLTLTSDRQQVQVRVTLSPENLLALKKILP